MEQTDLSYPAGGSAAGTAGLEDSLTAPTRLNACRPRAPASLLPRTQPREQACVQHKACTRMFRMALCVTAAARSCPNDREQQRRHTHVAGGGPCHQQDGWLTPNTVTWISSTTTTLSQKARHGSFCGIIASVRSTKGSTSCSGARQRSPRGQRTAGPGDVLFLDVDAGHSGAPSV